MVDNEPQTPTLRSRKYLNSKTPTVTISSDEESYSSEFLLGLTLAGVAASLLSTVFGLLHVDVFLRVYELPLPSFATGSLVFGVINTAIDLVGGWCVDAHATRQSRSNMVGVAGCFLAVGFLAPFFRWSRGLGHFVISMILIGSVVTDNHHMSDSDRVNFMASGKVVSLIADFAVARLGLEIFETNDMEHLQLFLLLLAIVVCCIFVIAQFMMGVSSKALVYSHLESPDHKPKRPLQASRVCRDFWNHNNFRAWICMELLLESQSSFSTSFLKTFVDRLILGEIINRDACDIVLSLMRPLTQVAEILCYIPIRKMGYSKVYMWLFGSNLVMSLICMLFGSPSNSYLTLAFLVAYNVGTGAVKSAGFHLAMSDMVLEMKYKHAADHRYDEPSLAGMFMGANSLLCKPMESLLPFVAAVFLDDTKFQADEKSESAQWVLYYLLVMPPLLFSGLQILSWSHYTLLPGKTNKMRGELRRMIVDLEGNQTV
jgi:Na+/melibiose symporter-like transporter